MNREELRDKIEEEVKEELREEMAGRSAALAGSSFGRRNFRDVGGTSGGLGEFFAGLVLLGLGGYLLMGRVVVQSGFRTLFGMNEGGLTLLPIFFGIALLFFRARSIIGWVLTVGGALAMIAEILADLQLYFRPTTLFHTLLMLGMTAAGLGMVFRSVRPHD